MQWLCALKIAFTWSLTKNEVQNVFTPHLESNTLWVMTGAEFIHTHPVTHTCPEGKMYPELIVGGRQVSTSIILEGSTFIDFTQYTKDIKSQMASLEARLKILEDKEESAQ